MASASIALVVILSVARASTSPAIDDCTSGMKILQWNNDVELAARCRAAYLPDLCQNVARTLGPRPWSEAHVADTCAKFGPSLLGEEGRRSLETSMEQKQKHGLPLDASVLSKADQEIIKTLQDLAEALHLPGPQSDQSNGDQQPQYKNKHKNKRFEQEDGASKLKLYLSGVRFAGAHETLPVMGSVSGAVVGVFGTLVLVSRLRGLRSLRRDPIETEELESCQVLE